MDPRYRDIFFRIYNGYVSLYTEGRPDGLALADEYDIGKAAAQINREIQSAGRDLRARGLELRPDAATVLLVNAMALVVQPLAQGGEVVAEEIAFDATQDLRTIVERAADEAGEPEVSGRAVLRAIESTWDGLRTTARKAWD